MSSMQGTAEDTDDGFGSFSTNSNTSTSFGDDDMFGSFAAPAPVTDTGATTTTNNDVDFAFGDFATTTSAPSPSTPAQPSSTPIDDDFLSLVTQPPHYNPKETPTDFREFIPMDEETQAAYIKKHAQNANNPPANVPNYSASFFDDIASLSSPSTITPSASKANDDADIPPTPSSTSSFDPFGDFTASPSPASSPAIHNDNSTAVTSLSTSQDIHPHSSNLDQDPTDPWPSSPSSSEAPPVQVQQQEQASHDDLMADAPSHTHASPDHTTPQTQQTEPSTPSPTTTSPSPSLSPSPSALQSTHLDELVEPNNNNDEGMSDVPLESSPSSTAPDQDTASDTQPSSSSSPTTPHSPETTHEHEPEPESEPASEEVPQEETVSPAEIITPGPTETQKEESTPLVPQQQQDKDEDGTSPSQATPEVEGSTALPPDMDTPTTIETPDESKEESISPITIDEAPSSPPLPSHEGKEETKGEDSLNSPASAPGHEEASEDMTFDDVSFSSTISPPTTETTPDKQEEDEEQDKEDVHDSPASATSADLATSPSHETADEPTKVSEDNGFGDFEASEAAPSSPPSHVTEAASEEGPSSTQEDAGGDDDDFGGFSHTSFSTPPPAIAAYHNEEASPDDKEGEEEEEEDVKERDDEEGEDEDHEGEGEEDGDEDEEGDEATKESEDDFGGFSSFSAGPAPTTAPTTNTPASSGDFGDFGDFSATNNNDEDDGFGDFGGFSAPVGGGDSTTDDDGFSDFGGFSAAPSSKPAAEGESAGDGDDGFSGFSSAAEPGDVPATAPVATTSTPTPAPQPPSAPAVDTTNSILAKNDEEARDLATQLMRQAIPLPDKRTHTDPSAARSDTPDLLTIISSKPHSSQSTFWGPLRCRVCNCMVPSPGPGEDGSPQQSWWCVQCGSGVGQGPSWAFRGSLLEKRYTGALRIPWEPAPSPTSSTPVLSSSNSAHDVLIPSSSISTMSPLATHAPHTHSSLDAPIFSSTSPSSSGESIAIPPSSNFEIASQYIANAPVPSASISSMATPSSWDLSFVSTPNNTATADAGFLDDFSEFSHPAVPPPANTSFLSSAPSTIYNPPPPSSSSSSFSFEDGFVGAETPTDIEPSPTSTTPPEETATVAAEEPREAPSLPPQVERLVSMIPDLSFLLSKTLVLPYA
eukprot:TRINITY_DN3727_c0_g1_i6.p2 TRINITY_DN3727_c0_g1~~TRINITY_DN3727_c0_g1_i6.p2  ORF type:complete len:1157 (+),score=385.54 TRINITY_DN3727_c0_g1_i6:3510-6980(+)